jgi:hypothetical protein
VPKETKIYFPCAEMLSAGWGSQLSLKRERLSNPGGLITRRAVSIYLMHVAVCSNQPPAIILKNYIVFELFHHDVADKLYFLASVFLLIYYATTSMMLKSFWYFLLMHYNSASFINLLSVYLVRQMISNISFSISLVYNQWVY